MKTSLTFLMLLAASACHGFAPTSTNSQRPVVTSLDATQNNNNNNNNHNKIAKSTSSSAAAALLLGVTIMTAAPFASMAETSLDFSLPSYDTKMSTFGDGNEARLYDKREMTDPGANEREKQAEAMKRAEEARKERIAKEKAIAKARDEEARVRAAEKKARDAERLKNIWAN